MSIDIDHNINLIKEEIITEQIAIHNETQNQDNDDDDDDDDEDDEDDIMYNNIINYIKMIDISLLDIQPFNERNIIININGIISVENITTNNDKGCYSIEYIYHKNYNGIIRECYYTIAKFG